MCGIFLYLSPQGKANTLQKYANGIRHRGPDDSRYLSISDNNVLMVFHRLSINDTSDNGMQPFVQKLPDGTNGKYLVCNGEIYNYKNLIKTLHLDSKYTFQSSSDCECLLPMSDNLSINDICKSLDGVFAFIIWDDISKTLIYARDPLGVRPLFIGHNDRTDEIIVCSEHKGIPPSWSIAPVEPGTANTISLDNNFKPLNKSIDRYIDLYNHNISMLTESYEHIDTIRRLLTDSVEKRMLSDRPIGCLLSGGLDSTIIAALVQATGKAKNPNYRLHTFSIGLKGSPDLEYAKIVSKHLNTIHKEIIVTEKLMKEAAKDTIKQIESYDTTTVRASTPMFLLSKWIKKNTDITVIFSGEGADEIFGSYLYFSNAPNPRDFQNETERLLKNLHYFDVLRGDRTTAGAGLEIRVPFLDKQFVKYCVAIPPVHKMSNKDRNIPEKHLLREAFKEMIPQEVYKRTKEAFSDGVTASNTVPWYGGRSISEEQEEYKQVFLKYYPKREDIIPYYWKAKWVSDSQDPSARTYMKKSPEPLDIDSI